MACRIFLASPGLLQNFEVVSRKFDVIGISRKKKKELFEEESNPGRIRRPGELFLSLSIPRCIYGLCQQTSQHAKHVHYAWV